MTILTSTLQARIQRYLETPDKHLMGILPPDIREYMIADPEKGGMGYTPDDVDFAGSKEIKQLLQREPPMLATAINMDRPPVARKRFGLLKRLLHRGKKETEVRTVRG